jgi:hypothetical protein
MNILLEGNIVEDSARFLPLVSIVLFQKAPADKVYAELTKQTAAAQPSVTSVSISLAIRLGKAPAGSSPVRAITGTGG